LVAKIQSLRECGTLERVFFGIGYFVVKNKLISTTTTNANKAQNQSHNGYGGHLIICDNR